MNSTVLRRQIGRIFRRLRKQANLTVQQAAVRAEMGKSTITRIEEGADTVRFKDRDVEALLRVYDTPADEHELTLAMTREARNSGGNGAWWQSYTTTELPRGFSLLVRLEPAAETITEYQPELVPALVQTRSYAEGLFRVGESAQDNEPLIDIRMQRQQAIWPRDKPLRFDVVLNEAVLRRPIGGPSVMAEQLQHVLEISEQNTISVRMLPFSAGAYLGIGTPFIQLAFPDDSSTGEPIEPPLVYIDTFGGGVTLNEDADITAYRSAWSDVSTRALDEPTSREWIAKAMKEYQND